MYIFQSENFNLTDNFEIKDVKEVSTVISLQSSADDSQVSRNNGRGIYYWTHFQKHESDFKITMEIFIPLVGKKNGLLKSRAMVKTMEK